MSQCVYLNDQIPKSDQLTHLWTSQMSTNMMAFEFSGAQNKTNVKTKK